MSDRVCVCSENCRACSADKDGQRAIGVLERSECTNCRESRCHVLIWRNAICKCWLGVCQVCFKETRSYGMGCA